MAHVDNELRAAVLFDYAVVNDDLEQAVREVLEVIAAVRDGSETRLSEIAVGHGRESVLARWGSAQGRG
jgi:guanylate kinase